MNGHPRVKGYCPSCGNDSLFLGQGGYVTCSLIGCEKPDAVSDLLDDSEINHIVELGEDEFTIRHPLMERIDDALMTCTLMGTMARRGSPPPKPGRYRVYRNGESSYDWVEIA